MPTMSSEGGVDAARPVTSYISPSNHMHSPPQNAGIEPIAMHLYVVILQLHTLCCRQTVTERTAKPCKHYIEVEMGW